MRNIDRLLCIIMAFQHLNMHSHILGRQNLVQGGGGGGGGGGG